MAFAFPCSSSWAFRLGWLKIFRPVYRPVCYTSVHTPATHQRKYFVFVPVTICSWGTLTVKLHFGQPWQLRKGTTSAQIIKYPRATFHASGKLNAISINISANWILFLFCVVFYSSPQRWPPKELFSLGAVSCAHGNRSWRCSGGWMSESRFGCQNPCQNPVLDVGTQTETKWGVILIQKLN